MDMRLKLVLVVFGAFAVAEGVRYVGAADAAGAAKVNPSQTTQGQNPSQTLPVNPSQTLPGVNPSQAAPAPVNPNVPNPNVVVPAAAPDVPLIEAPNDPAARRSLVDRQTTTRVLTAITQGPIASNGTTAFGATGIAVSDLRITTSGGKVILRGVVGSEKDKAAAGARAAAVAGEQSVVNELLVR